MGTENFVKKSLGTWRKYEYDYWQEEHGVVVNSSTVLQLQQDLYNVSFFNLQSLRAFGENN